eukprot:3461132-Pleurochrysis_carterae.AAC.2
MPRRPMPRSPIVTTSNEVCLASNGVGFRSRKQRLHRAGQSPVLEAHLSPGGRKRHHEQQLGQESKVRARGKIDPERARRDHELNARAWTQPQPRKAQCARTHFGNPGLVALLTSSLGSLRLRATLPLQLHHVQKVEADPAGGWNTR